MGEVWVRVFGGGVGCGFVGVHGGGCVKVWQRMCEVVGEGMGKFRRMGT